MSDIEPSDPELQTEPKGGGAGKPPRPTAIATKSPDPESKSPGLLERILNWILGWLVRVHPEVPHGLDSYSDDKAD